jgi:TP901 family phage tail tape measure protein
MAGTANGGEIRARLTLENGQFMQNMQQAQGQMGQLSQSAQASQADIKRMEGALKGIGVASVAMIGAAVATAANFEQSMARVAAVSGASASEFQALEQAALDAGASTAFSASQAADALGYLAMAGFDAKEQVAALPNVLNLASAAQMDLASSADIVSNIMTGFGLTAEETDRATDVLTKTMTTANTDLHQLGEAMKYVAPVAAGVGWSIEESAAAIAKMSDAGIQGSQAGTALRASILSLASPVGQTEKAIEGLGLKLKDTEGNLLPLPELIGEVSSKMEGMSDTEKTAYASMLVGREAASGFVTLINQGEDALSDYTATLENSAGTAERVAQVQNDTVNGAFKEFLSAVEGASIGIGKEFLPEIKELIKAGTGIVRWVADLNPKMIEFALKMAAGASAVGLTVMAVNKLKVAIPLMMRSVQLSMGPIGWLSLGLGAVAAALIDVKDESKEVEEVNLDTAKSYDQQSKSLDKAITAYEALQEKSKLSNDEFGRYIDIQKQLELETNADKIKKLKDEQAKLAEKSGLSNEELNEMIGLNKDIIEQAPMAADGLTETGEAIVGNTEAAREYNDELREKLRLELEQQTSNAWAGLEENIKTANEALKERRQIAQDIRQAKQDVINAEGQLATKTAILNEVRKTGDKSSIQNAEREVQLAEQALGKAEEQVTTEYDKLTASEKNLNTARLSVMEGQQAVQSLMDYYLKQVDVTAEKGKEVEALDAVIKKTEEAKGKLDQKLSSGKQLTEEEQKQYDALAEQLGVLEYTRLKVGDLVTKQDEFTGAITDSKGEMIDLNVEGNKDLAKWIEAEGWTLDDAETLNSEAEKKIDKKIAADDMGTVDKINKSASKKEKKEVDVSDKGDTDKINAKASKKEKKEVDVSDKGDTDRINKSASKTEKKKVNVSDKGDTDKINAKASKSENKRVHVSDGGDVAAINKKAEEPIWKKIFLSPIKTASNLWNAVTGNRHAGGTVHQLPKYHTGGNVESPSLGDFGRMGQAPKFNEVDVRLLRNEMVLTTAQQANLFRLIDTFGNIQKQQLKDMQEPSAAAGDTVIQVGSLVVREEADIRKIAEELDRLNKYKTRGKGGR